MVHIPIPFAGIGRALQRFATYFRSGVAAEGRAWLCDAEHPMVISLHDVTDRRVPQHVDVDLRFWNRRDERVTVLEIAEARIPSYDVELVDSGWPGFKSLTLEPGADRQERFFVLVPKDAPDTRVEATVGSWLEMTFRPSRGSERWAQPRVRVQLGVRSDDDRLG